MFTQLLSLLFSLFPYFFPKIGQKIFIAPPQLSLKFSLSCKEMQVKNIWLILGNNNWFSCFSQVNVRQYMKTTASRWCLKNIVVWYTLRWQGACFKKGKEWVSIHNISLFLSIVILNYYFSSWFLILLVGGYNDYADIGITIELVKCRNIYPPFPIFLSYHTYIFINNFDLAFHLWIEIKSYLRDLCKPKTLKTNT